MKQLILLQKFTRLYSTNHVIYIAVEELKVKRFEINLKSDNIIINSVFNFKNKQDLLRVYKSALSLNGQTRELIHYGHHIHISKEEVKLMESKDKESVILQIEILKQKFNIK